MRAEHRAIRDAIDGYTKTGKPIFGESTEGAMAFAYQDQEGEVRLIDVTYYGESGRTRYEVYYAERRVFYVRKQVYAYNAPIYFTEEKVKQWSEEDVAEYQAFDDEKTVLKEHRYYFDDDRLIRYIAPDSNADIGNFSANEAAQSILKHARQLLSLFNSAQP